jgi:hypothetical protein
VSIWVQNLIVVEIRYCVIFGTACEDKDGNRFTVSVELTSNKALSEIVLDSIVSLSLLDLNLPNKPFFCDVDL